MRTSHKLLATAGVIALAGIAGNAFTGTGVTTSGSAASDQFVGGTVSQSVTGATLSEVTYGFTDGTSSAVKKVTLTFADATGGKTPTISLSGGTAATFTCLAIDPSTFVSVCDAATGTSQTGVNSIAVTVS